MSDKTIELTLSRWHKTAERLSAKAQELSQTALKSFTQLRVDGNGGEAQQQQFRALREAAHEALRAHGVCQEAIGAIRSALARANSAFGVSEKIGRMEALNRRMKLIRDILAGQKPEMIGAEDLPNWKPAHEGAQRISYHRDEPQGALLIRILEKDKESALREEADALQRDIYKIADEANDLNRAKIAIAISPEAAGFASV